jgi:cytochrome c oxidase accessory protein FixG
MTDKTSDRSDDDQSFYAKHKKVYPREVHGIFARLRVLGVLLLLGPYYLLPWISWNGQHILLFDLPARKFYIFGLTIWPQDFLYLAILLIIAGIALFFFTSLAGRLWCGYACPQTVWTEAFLWIERKIEGTRNQQIKLDKGKLTGKKFYLKSLKHFVWLAFALWTGFTFVGYFSPIHDLGVRFLSLDLGNWETFWVFFYGLATYGNAGWLREQVCIYMCPYARFQSAMFDKDTLVISYDEQRGEPRGHRKKDQDISHLGDCVDCSLCVQACPTGIDIRDGLQYQCIGCAACIDACDSVMEKTGLPKGLVRYTTENAMEGKPSHILRPRVIVYALILTVLTVTLLYMVSTKSELELDIIRDRNSLYRTTPDGEIENSYTIRIINMSDKNREYRLVLGKELAGARLKTPQDGIKVPAGAVRSFAITIDIAAEHLKRPITEIRLKLDTVDGSVSTIEKTRFIGPAPGR